MSDRPIPAVSALVIDSGRVLLVKRGCEPNKGLWSLPGGSIELGETARAAAAREVREETALEVEPREFAGFQEVISQGDDGIRFHYVIITFRARLVSGELAAASDAADARWFAPCELAGIPTTEGLAARLADYGFR